MPEPYIQGIKKNIKFAILAACFWLQAHEKIFQSVLLCEAAWNTYSLLPIGSNTDI